MPPGSTRPQRPARCQSSSVSRTSRRGCEVIARWTSRSAARVQARESSAREICGQGLTRSANASSSSASRAGRARARSSALEQVVGARGERLQHVAVADDLGRRAVADADVDAERAVDHEHAGAVADLRRSSARGRSRRAVRRTRRRSRPGGPPAACAGRAPRRGRRRGRAGSGRTTSAARPCSRARATRATARSPCGELPVGPRWRAPRDRWRAVAARARLDGAA